MPERAAAIAAFYCALVASAAYSYGRSRIPEVIDVSWDYLCYVRNHPISWAVPTHILYGSEDNLTSFEIIQDFAEKHNAVLTVMEGGGHWFHTEEQMRFLDDWIRKAGSLSIP